MARAVIGTAVGLLVVFGVVTSAPGSAHEATSSLHAAGTQSTAPPVHSPSVVSSSPAASGPTSSALAAPRKPAVTARTVAPRSARRSSSAGESSAVTAGVAPVPGTRAADDPFLSRGLYAVPTALPAGVAPADAVAIRRLLAQPQFTWLTTTAGVRSSAANVAAQASAHGELALLVAYNIPGRDCGSYSSGGAQSPSAYVAWIGQLAAGIAGRPAVVILEPDALAQLTSCLSAAAQGQRLSLIAQAIGILRASPNTAVYVDAGNSTWIDRTTMAQRLNAAGISRATGFALNVSNFNTTAQEESYGNALSALTGGKHFIVDTSRNGRGSANGAWCNPAGRALGAVPGSATHDSLADALLWVKRPGESDGTCNGGPAAGTFWPAYAAGLAHAAGW